MLSSPTPYPYVGSYALIVHEGANTLARIVMRRADELVVSLPLVAGASGNLRVTPDRLIDATPLTGEETREFHDLDRALRGIDYSIQLWAEEKVPGPKPRMTAKQKVQAARRDALRRRVIHAPIMERLLREASIRIAA